MAVHKLLIEILGKDKASPALKKAGKSVANLDKQAQTLSKGLAASVGVAGFAYLGKQALGAAVDLAQLGAQALQAEDSFNKLAGRIGETGDSLLSAIRDASAGTVSDMTIMQTTAGLLASGIQTSSADIASAMEIARLKAQQFGLSTAEAYQRMLDGARKFSVEMLDEIGITIKAESAYKRRADALGTTVKALTDAERAEALWQAILQDGRAELAQYGGATVNYASQMEEMSASVENAKAALGEALAPAVASVADALADAIPNLVTTIEHLGILADAGVAWAKAALTGADAEAAFNASMADSIGATKEAARIRLEAAQQSVDAMRAEIAALGELGQAYDVQYALDAAEAQLALARANYDVAQSGGFVDGAMKLWLDTQRAIPPVTEAVGAAAAGASTGIIQLSGTFQTGNPAALAYAESLYAVNTAIRDVVDEMGKVTAAEIGTGFAGATSQIESQLLSLVGVVDAATLRRVFDQYTNELQSLYQEATDLTDFELAMRQEVITNRLDETIDAFRGAAGEEKQVLGTMADQYSSLRSAVQSALSATAVTAADMDLSAAGDYVDKWDENARRLDAIAQRGFAELEQHADWAAVLKIPPELLTGSEAALKQWAQSTANAVRDLSRPDLIDVGAAADAVERFMQAEAAKEMTIDLVIGELQTRGVSAEAAKKTVQQLYGMEEGMELPILPTLQPEAIETFRETTGAVPLDIMPQFVLGDDAGGNIVGEQFVLAIQESLAGVSIGAQLTAIVKGDIEASEKALNRAGKQIWYVIELGLFEAMAEMNLADKLVEMIAVMVARLAASGDVYQGGEGEP